jgi:hypothetical protein
MIKNKINFTDSQIIDLLGGVGKVSFLCNISHAAVCQWKKNGIPHAQFVFLAATLERESHGLITRKDIFPNSWHIIWPELQESEW